MSGNASGMSLYEYKSLLFLCVKLYSQMNDSWSMEADAALSDMDGNSGVPLTPGRHLDCAESDDDVLMLGVGEEEEEEVIGTKEDRAKMRKRKIGREKRSRGSGQRRTRGGC